MTNIETMKLALEALEINLIFLRNVKPFKGQEDLTSDCIAMTEDAITDLRQAIEQAQKLVAWKLVPRDATDEMLKAMDECSTEGYDERLYAGHAASVFMAAVDAAPAPPQRTWVGLTEDEILSISADCASSHQHTDIHFARAIEAALKAKNT